MRPVHRWLVGHEFRNTLKVYIWPENLEQVYLVRIFKLIKVADSYFLYILQQKFLSIRIRFECENMEKKFKVFFFSTFYYLTLDFAKLIVRYITVGMRRYATNRLKIY